MKPFSNLIRHKKAIALLLLFFIVSGIIVPQVASADPIEGAAWGAAAGAVGCAAGYGLSAIGLYFGVGWIALPVVHGVCSTLLTTSIGIGALYGLTTEANNFTKAIIVAAGEVLYNVADGLAIYAVKLLESFLTVESVTSPVLSQEGFSKGWAQVRDLANMFVVLGFVFVGIAFTLRIEGYGTKKVLINLILVALLINFSGLFCGLIIDASNKITIHFLQGDTGEFAGNQLGSQLVRKIEVAHDLTPFKTIAADKQQGATGVLLRLTSFILSLFLVAATFFYLSFILYVRTAIFGIFFVLSPLAFVCWVFPATKKLWSMWWENFIKWALIGAQIAFFVWVASLIISKTSTITILGVSLPSPVISNQQLIAVLILLWVAVTVAKKSSAIGAGAVIGLAAGAAGAVWGASKWAGKKSLGAAWEQAGRTPLGRATREWASNAGARIAESTGFAKTGYAAQQRQKRAAEAEKQVAAMAAAPAGSGDRNRYERLVRNGRGAMGAAAVNVASKNGDLNSLFGDQGMIDRRIAYASQFGYDAGEMAKSSPDSAKNDTKRVEQIMNERPTLSKEDAQKVAVKEAYAKHKVEGLNQMNNTELVGAMLSCGNNNALRSKYLEQLTDNNGLGDLSKELGRRGMNNSQAANQITGWINTAEQTYGSKVRGDARKKMPTLEAYDDNADAPWRKIKTETGWTDDQAKQEAVVRRAAKMAPEDLNMDFAQSVDYRVIESLQGRLTGKQKQSFRASTENQLKQQANTFPSGSPQKLAVMQKLAAMRRATT